LDLFDKSPLRRLNEHLSGGLTPGQLGAVLARAGLGKSTLLVHIGLDALLRDIPVLHVSLRDQVDHVRSYYDEIFTALMKAKGTKDRANAMVAAERHRMIHSYLDSGGADGRAFSVENLRSSLKMLKDVAQFVPQLILVDGLDDRGLDEHGAGLKALAAQAPLWLTVRGRGEDPRSIDGWVAEHCVAALRLFPKDRYVGIALHLPAGPAGAAKTVDLDLDLDPTTMLVVSSADEARASAVSTPRPTDCMLYSGGANGAEEEFGLCAEKWGVNEVNFTFEGHKQSRTRGRYELSPRELQAGDVSLVYVSKKLHRTYSEGSLIRNVLQTIWHMVSRSQQVFVIGEVQPDGTVKGGTGWSVELARMWNKNLWVYDQGVKHWVKWDGTEFVPGQPIIESIHFTGTGTRYLTDEGRAAIHDLFERSFARRVDG
jgi:hypothetical protein